MDRRALIPTRPNPSGGSSSPICAISANARQGRRQSLQDSGFPGRAWEPVVDISLPAVSSRLPAIRKVNSSPHATLAQNPSMNKLWRFESWRLVCLGVALVASLAPHLGCGKPPSPAPEPSLPPWFEDVTEQAGLDFVHDAGPVSEANYFMPQIVGSGAALFDFDGDGLLDIYLLNNGGPN